MEAPKPRSRRPDDRGRDPLRPANGSRSADLEVPQRTPEAGLRRILERCGVEIGQMPRRSVVRPAEADLDAVRPQFDELLDRAQVVLHGGRADAPGHPVPISPDLAVVRLHGHRAAGFVEIDLEGPELTLSLVIATAGNGLSGKRSHHKRYDGRKRQTRAVHSIPTS